MINTDGKPTIANRYGKSERKPIPLTSAAERQEAISRSFGPLLRQTAKRERAR